MSPTASGCDPSRDFVEGRIGDLISVNRRGSLDYFRERLQYAWIPIAAVDICILFPIPQTRRDGLGSARDDERQFVFEALLLSKYGKDLLFNHLHKCRNAIRS